jgi:hypothetical protein
MIEKATDQIARDMAARALAAIERHEAVCSEAERRRAQQIEDMEKNLQEWLRRIQETYDRSWSDISSRHSNAMVIVNGNTNKFFDEQKKINEQLTNRFWALLWAYSAGATAVAAALLWHFVTK